MAVAYIYLLHNLDCFAKVILVYKISLNFIRIIKGLGSMTRSELVARLLSLHPLLTHDEAERVVASVFNRISEAMIKGKRVELRGFGIFSTRLRDPRPARNPKTGEKVMLQERRSPFFRAGKELKERMNQVAKN